MLKYFVKNSRSWKCSSMTDHLSSIKQALNPVCSTENNNLGWPVIEMYNHSMQKGMGGSFHWADHDCTFFFEVFFSKPFPHQASVDFVPITFYHIIMVHLSF